MIGNDTCIGRKAEIEPYTVIGNGCLIQENASIKRSVLWNNVYLDRGAALRGAVLCSRVQVRANAQVYEGAVVGSDSILQENCVVKPGVKLWPDKLVETRATVNSSLVWGTRWPKKVFGLEGVTGLVNIEVTPEFACRLGASLSSVLGSGAKVGVSADSYPSSHMLKEALITGIQSAGATVYDLGTEITPMNRFAVRSLNLKGGVHVKISHRRSDQATMVFIDNKGGNISKSMERKIENILMREDFPRVESTKVKPREFVSGMIENYLQKIIEQIDVSLIRQARLRLIMAYDPHNLGSFVEFLGQALNIEIVNLDSSNDFPLDWENYLEYLPYLARKVHDGGAYAGVMLDSNADRLVLVDEKGRLIQDNMLTVLTALIILKAKNGPVVVPVTAPYVVENLAKRYRSSVVRTKTAVQNLIEEVLKQNEQQFLLNFDALGALTSILGFTVRNKLSLGDLVDEIPSFFTAQKEIPVSWEAKGRVIRSLIEESKKNIELLDGVKVFYPGGWALVLPDPEEPVCRIFSEGASMEIAESLAEFYKEKIGKIVEQN